MTTKKFYVHEGTKTIKKEMFKNVDISEFTEIIIPYGVTAIGLRGFKGLVNLEKVTIPESIKSIGKNAFESCKRLKNIKIPNRVTKIGNCAFMGCESLKSVTIPNSVTNIGDKAFGYYYDENSDEYVKSENFTIYGHSNSEAEKYASENGFSFAISVFESILLEDGTVEITAYNGSDTDLVIPDTIDGCIVTSIDDVFKGCTSLKSITIPNTITNIGYGAFLKCLNLRNINVSSDNKYYSSIDGNLYNKDKTELIQYAIGKSEISFEIPNGVTEIKSLAFSYCENLKSVTIPKGVTTIDNAFSYCTNLMDVTIPEGVINIIHKAFVGCKSLKNITIPNSVTFIGYRTFRGCKNLTKIILSEHLITIGPEAFVDCKKLTDVIIPNSVKIIGRAAFANCENLVNVTIPDGIEKIYRLAFCECEKLTSVTLPNKLTRREIRSAFPSTTKIEWKD